MGIALILAGGCVAALLLGLATRAAGRAGMALRHGEIGLPAALRSAATAAVVWPLPILAAIALLVALVLRLETGEVLRLGFWLYGIALCGTLPMALAALLLGVWHADRAVRAGDAG